MAGTRKIRRFDNGASAPRTESGTRRLEKFDLPRAAAQLAPRVAPVVTASSIATPIEEVSMATRVAAMASLPPPPDVDSEPPRSSDPGTPPDSEPETSPDSEPETQPPDSEPETPPDSEPRLSSAPRSLDREADVERLRTRLARRFTTVADEATAAFDDFSIGAGAWHAELTAPEGMSTGGGAQSVLHFRLRPTRQGYRSLLGGHVDLATKTAELRSYETMVAVHHARFFGTPVDFSEGEWEQFLRKAEVVLRAIGVASTRVAPSPELRTRTRRRFSISGRTLAAVALGFITPTALLILWRVLRVLLR